jgi:hypothetical protein
MRNSLRLTACALLVAGFAFGVHAPSYAGIEDVGPMRAVAPGVPTIPNVTKSFHATLSGRQQVPPVAGSGKGSADFKLDVATKTLTWTITYSRLSGDAMAAHIHGPATVKSNAAIEVDLAPNGMANPLTGSAVLTDAQIADLSAGKTYVNLHTAKNKDGEIRGQIKPAK